MINKTSSNQPSNNAHESFDGLNRFVRRAKTEYFHNTLAGAQKATAQKTESLGQKKIPKN